MKIVLFKILDRPTVQLIVHETLPLLHLGILLSCSPAKEEQDDSGQDGERKEDASHQVSQYVIFLRERGNPTSWQSPTPI